MSETVHKNELIPRLRFPGFGRKWKDFRVDEIGRVVTGRTPPTSDPTLYAGGYLFVTPTDIDDKRFVVTTRTTLTKVGALSAPSVRAGSTCVVCIASIGKIAQTAKECVTNQQINSVEPFAQFDDTFTYYSLCMLVPKLKQVAGQQTMQILNKSEFSAMRMLMPDVAEQRKVAECLGSLDELIAAETEKLEALERHKKGLLQQLFPAEGNISPRLRFPEFRGTGEWTKLSLAELIASLDAGVSVNSIDRPAMSNEIGVLKTSAVTNGIFVSEENKVIFDEREKGRVKEPVTKDTIILSRMNTPLLVGANAYVKASQQNLFLPDRLWAVKCRPGVSTRFLAIMLGSDRGRKDLADLAKGSSGSMKNIAKPDVLTLSIMAPLQDEQDRIAECIAYVEDIVDSQMQELRILKVHKVALMAQLFPSLDETEQ